MQEALMEPDLVMKVTQTLALLAQDFILAGGT